MNIVILVFQSYLFLNLYNLLLDLTFSHSEFCMWFISKIIYHCYKTISIVPFNVPPILFHKFLFTPLLFHILSRSLFTYPLFSIFRGKSELFRIFYSRFSLFGFKYSFLWFSGDHLAKTLVFRALYRSSLNYILALVHFVY